MSSQIREIRKIDLFTYGILPLILIIFIWTCGTIIPQSVFNIELPWWVYVIYGIVTYLILHRFAIGVVLFYKAFAPLETRDRCRFEPTCSTYMILAIKKFGLIIGVIKGIRRILRCKPPNGGIDYP